MSTIKLSEIKTRRFYIVDRVKIRDKQSLLWEAAVLDSALRFLDLCEELHDDQ